MRSTFLIALVPFNASEMVENRTKNRKSNNYLGYLREIGWILSAALYNTRRSVNLVSKEGEWNETWWIKENIENADVNNSLITNMADVAQWNILLGKNERSWRITPKVSYPTPQRGWIGVPKWVHEGTLIRKLLGGGKKMQQTTKWWQHNGDKRNYCAGHKGLKNTARTSVLEKINPKMGTKLSYSPKMGKATLPKGDKQVVRSHRWITWKLMGRKVVP